MSASTPQQELNNQAATMFESGEEPEVSQGLGLMNELVVPCIPLLLAHDAHRDLMAVEDMRNRWCSYLGQEMECRFPGADTRPRLSQISTGSKELVHLEQLGILSPQRLVS